jgi:hypothetical protein
MQPYDVASTRGSPKPVYEQRLVSKGIDPLEASPIDLPDARLPAAASVKPLGVTAC